MTQRISNMLIGGAGICCLDHVFVAPRMSWGETARVQDYRCQCGGLVGTALAACSRLGSETRLASLLGKDPAGQQMLEQLNAVGICTDDIVEIGSGRSPVSFIHLDADNGERTIFHYGARDLKWPRKALPWLEKCSALLIDDYYPELALQTALAAAKLKIPVVADTWPKKNNRELLRRVDVLISPRHFAVAQGFGADYKAALKAMRDAGPRITVLTLGEEGWIASDSMGEYTGKGFRVEAIDTLGAGDVFHGAFAFAIGRKWSTPRCAEFASAVAALKCANSRGWLGIPGFEETLGFLRTNSSNDWNHF